MTRKKKYYDTLGVSENVSEEEIKSAYNKLTLKWHPDMHDSPEKKAEAEKKMQEINEAYEVLGNSKKRQHYDQYGTTESSGQNFYNRETFSSDIFDQGESFFKDFMDSVFGNQDSYNDHSYSREDKNQSQDGDDILVEITLTFKESILGTKKKVPLNLKKRCKDCNQTGAYSSKDIYECPTCKGIGVVNTIQKTIFGIVRTQTTCSHCRGKKKVIKKKCVHCRGSKFVLQREVVELNIPRGIQPKKKYRYQGIGNEGLHGGRKGDIYVNLEVNKNSYFRREGYDIHVNLPISFLDAILGNNVEVITLEGIKKVKIIPGTQNNDCLILKNHGCYVKINDEKDRGDLYIWLQVKLPRKITSMVEEVLKDIQKKANWDPNHDFVEKNKNIADK
ncbi:DnaJ C-terminal domain-containing protein [endosymbiont GvMRE of Glomus versiforme]|uniref:DnaJ C-terminal domain-containing protein n=1 Tax=endosymbiont GvMRE of Glomus versiforme TaxID=2039283 RepID=UPI000EE7D6C0|nr:DnaJ C-terminal domain-containing protein [endosymbiont GvMRE of Glomus versiforme]RHZ35635.1 Chaperone protein DnaJ [endosymbiont GvMRE of Glomus versiforme]